jgi:hypothetical protein
MEFEFDIDMLISSWNEVWINQLLGCLFERLI